MGQLKIFLILQVFLILSSVSGAGVIEGTFAASSTSYRTSGDQISGYTIRSRYRSFGVGANERGTYFTFDNSGTFGAGWGVSGQFMNWEAGIGGNYSPIFGPAVVLVAGVGADLGSNMVLSFPVFLNINTGVTATPYFGWRW